MEILGIGASELIFILIIAIIVLGPRDMEKAGRTIGRWLNQLVRSDSWKVFQKTSAELRNLPRNLMREANMEIQDLKDMDQEIRRTIDPRQTPLASRRNPSHRDVSQSVKPATDLPLSNGPEKPPASEPPGIPPAETNSDEND